MGSPKRQRKKFSTPTHPWQKERISIEKELLKSYGLNRKYEIWKMNTMLKNFTRQAKNLITIKNPQVEKERNQLLTKLGSLGLIGKEAKIEDVLSLTLRDVMERRLQTLVYRKNLARSLKQARQFIVHEHISLKDSVITAPSYIVPLEEEKNIGFAQGSSFSDINHPERSISSNKETEKTTKGKEGTKGKKETKRKKEEKVIGAKAEDKDKTGEKKEAKESKSEQKKDEKSAEAKHSK